MTEAYTIKITKVEGPKAYIIVIREGAVGHTYATAETQKFAEHGIGEGDTCRVVCDEDSMSMTKVEEI